MSNIHTQAGGDHYEVKGIQPFQLSYLVAEGDGGFIKLTKYLTRNKEGWDIQCEKAKSIPKLLVRFGVTRMPFSGMLLDNTQLNYILEFVKQEPREVQVALHRIIMAYLSIDNPSAEMEFRKDIPLLIDEIRDYYCK